MKQVHTLDTRKSGKYRYMKIPLFCHFAEQFQVFVGMSEPQSRFMQRIFYIEYPVIVREIIIKNPSRSNDYFFFSIIDRTESLILFGLSECIGYDKGRFRVDGTVSEVRFHRKIVGKYDDGISLYKFPYGIEKRYVACVVIKIYLRTGTIFFMKRFFKKCRKILFFEISYHRFREEKRENLVGVNEIV